MPGNPHNDNSLSTSWGGGKAASGAAVGGAVGSFWGPFGYGVGTAAGSLAGSMLQGDGVNFRGKYARNQAQFARDQLAPDMIAKMKAAKAAGIHPLIALGLNPASAPQQPMIPGQSADFGSAIKAGVDTTLAIRDAREMSGLRIEEQKLRNDWLRMQIRNSARARGAVRANSSRPPIREPAPSANPANAAERTFVTHEGEIETYQGGTTAEDLEREINDWAQWMPSTMRRAWQIFKKDLRSQLGITPPTWWDDMRRRGNANRRQWQKEATKAYRTPRSNWSRNPTHHF